jgi:hypothetical protein
MRTCQRLGVTGEELARGEEDEGERGRVLGPWGRRGLGLCQVVLLENGLNDYATFCWKMA